jgi:hypothetical protein
MRRPCLLQMCMSAQARLRHDLQEIVNYCLEPSRFEGHCTSVR